jgi:anti-sigma B factor antagonist
VFLAGELDLCTAPSFAAALAHVDPRRTSCLIIDLAELEFIDSSGLYQLVVALKRQHRQGGEVVLRSPRPSTLRVLDMSDWPKCSQSNDPTRASYREGGDIRPFTASGRVKGVTTS